MPNPNIDPADDRKPEAIPYEHNQDTEHPGPIHSDFFTSNFTNPEAVKSLLLLALKPSQLNLFDLDSIAVESNTLTNNEDLIGKYSDLLITINLKSGKNVSIHILVEHKSYTDPDVMCQVLQYISRLHANRGAKAVIPIVLYHGKDDWPVKMSFAELEYADYSPEFLEQFGNNLVDFEAIFLNLRDPDTFKRLDQLPWRERIVLKVLAKIKDGRVTELASFLSEAYERKDRQGEKLVASLRTYFSKTLGLNKMKEIGQKIKQKHLGENLMEQALKDTKFFEVSMRSSRNEGIAVGRKKGRVEGRVEGWEEGRVEGRVEGWEEGRVEGLEEGALATAYKVAKRMVQRGSPDEEIQQITELSMDDIAKLKEEIKN